MVRGVLSRAKGTCRVARAAREGAYASLGRVLLEESTLHGNSDNSRSFTRTRNGGEENARESSVRSRCVHECLVPSGKENRDRPSTRRAHASGYSVLVRGPEESAECSVPVIGDR